MRQDIRDFGVAMPDGIRLNECFNQLHNVLTNRPPIPADHGTTELSPRNEGNAMVASAEVAIRKAVSDGTLSIYVVKKKGPELVDRFSVPQINLQTMESGIYHSDECPTSDLVGRPLWVPTSDWRPFEQNQKGGLAAQADPQTPDDPLPVRSPNLPSAKLEAWWKKLSDADRQKPLDELWHMSRASFPTNSITRQRVRDLAPGRKRGPRPFGEKILA